MQSDSLPEDARPAEEVERKVPGVFACVVDGHMCDQ